jgi:hypothetical protein
MHTVQVVETVDFFPSNIMMPITASNDMTTLDATDLTHAFLHPVPYSSFSVVGESQLQEL